MGRATATIATRAKTKSAREIDRPIPKEAVRDVASPWESLEFHGSGAKRNLLSSAGTSVERAAIRDVDPECSTHLS